MKNPIHEKKKTRPYILKMFSMGIDLALWLIGLTSGAFHSKATEIPMDRPIPSWGPESE